MSTRTFEHAIKSKFVTLPGEHLVFIQRKHWLTFGFPTILLAILGFIFIVLIGALLKLAPNYSPLFLLTLSLGLTFIASLSLRSLIDWYFNFYVLTNRKIIVVSYTPLTYHKINQVLLDQVRCTEIDTKVEGIVNDFLDIGHIIITFDRPTHQEELVFEYIKHPRNIERFLQQTLYKTTFNSSYSLPEVNSNIQPIGIWQKHDQLPRWTYTEEVGQVLSNGVVWNI